MSKKIKLNKKLGIVFWIEGFSGSGIVSRLLKNRIMNNNSQTLKNFYVNLDMMTG